MSRMWLSCVGSHTRDLELPLPMTGREVRRAFSLLSRAGVRSLVRVLYVIVS